MSTLREELDEWEGLLKHPRWQELCAWAQEQTAFRTARVLSGEQEQRVEDRERGEIFGINLFIEYPQVLVETLRVELDNQQKEP